MAVGGALIALGVTLLTGAFGHDELTLGVESTSSGPRAAPGISLRAVVTPWGIAGTF
jgi:hypothetical protein